jgi:hypothetical protein
MLLLFSFITQGKNDDAEKKYCHDDGSENNEYGYFGLVHE